MKTGDTVKHGPSGETWTVAYVDGERLAWCGWPPGEARVMDCTLVEECSEEESIKLLHDLSGARCDNGTWDPRATYAQARLRELGLLPPLPPTEAEQLARLRAAIAEHHAQKADDRCVEDDDRLYAAAGLPPCDRRVGDKEDQLVTGTPEALRRLQSKLHTYVILEVSPQVYREVRDSLETAGYEHAFHQYVHEVTRDGEREGELTYEVIDMHGIALRAAGRRPCQPSQDYSQMPPDVARRHFAEREEKLRDDIRALPTAEKLRLAASFLDETNVSPVLARNVVRLALEEVAALVAEPKGRGETS